MSWVNFVTGEHRKTHLLILADIVEWSWSAAMNPKRTLAMENNKNNYILNFRSDL